MTTTERTESLIDLIKSKVAAKALSNRMEANGFRWLAEDEVYEIIRQHQADLVARIDAEMKKWPARGGVVSGLHLAKTIVRGGE